MSRSLEGDQTVAFHRVSRESNENVPITEDGTLPVRLFGEKLNQKRFLFHIDLDATLTKNAGEASLSSEPSTATAIPATVPVAQQMPVDKYPASTQRP